MFAYLYRYYFEQKGDMVKPVDKSTETPGLLNVADLVYSMCLHALIYSESVVTRQNNEIKLVSDVCRTYSEKYAFYRNSGNCLQDIHDAIQHHNGNAKNASAQLVQEYLRCFSSRTAVSDMFSERASRVLKKCMMRYIKSNNIKMLMFTISQVVQNLVVRCDLMYFKCLERGKKLISESLRLTYLRIPPCYMDILEKLDSIGDFIVSYGLGIIYKSKAHRAISSHNKIIGSLDSLIQIIESNKNEKIVSLYEEFILSIKSLNYYQTTINTYMKSSCLAEELYICACKYQNIEAVKIMLGYGVDVGAKSNRALYWACLKGNLSLIRTLVEHGINCNRFNGVARLWASLGKQNDALAMLDALGVSTDVPHHQECSSGGTEI
ncbi:putative ankyrin repeat protein [Zancudomyces culisetae]|uniref:Putative ankyrin repeat protein n=1 Tax=Zancudomyces culisetae TaxID=1213189 RepID=A0A1R1PS92_ZANCU|nr:putative ankyrin repeat protein [Zancudomyces culisetae]|eukprot:OMH83837.1 putative ankyrin repeat protein [Zancudomyces culisetae]